MMNAGSTPRLHKARTQTYAAPREIAVYDYTNILFTALFGFAFFGQIPDVWSCLGFAAILGAATRLR